MGVKDLWSILAPVCERKPLWDLQGKTVAVDLSCWVCDSKTLASNNVQPRMYLRNLFFRTSSLLLLGVKPVFVLEGEAPVLKYGAMSRRNELQYGKKCTQNKKCGRSNFRMLLCQCKKLLEIMGLTCVQSYGEAEALCALLNSKGVTEGCISQDSDCFLYGARTVYRNFTVGAHAAIDVYEMSVIEQKLGLGRRKMIALSLLCGCDYNEKGVTGVGKEYALRFLENISDGAVLARLNKWRSDAYYEQLELERAVLNKEACFVCLHPGTERKHRRNGCEDCRSSNGCVESTLPHILQDMDACKQKSVIAELSVRAKALQDPKFPDAEVIEEFLNNDSVKVPRVCCEWKQPDLIKFINFATDMLSWTEAYAFEKFLPLLTRWQLLNPDSVADPMKTSVAAKTIVKKRVSRNVASFELEWDLCNYKDRTDNISVLVTVEPSDLVSSAYPSLVASFNKAKEEKSKKVKSQSRGRRKKAVKENKTSSAQQMLMDEFISCREKDGESSQCDSQNNKKSTICNSNYDDKNKLIKEEKNEKFTNLKLKDEHSTNIPVIVKEKVLDENRKECFDDSVCENCGFENNCSLCSDSSDLDLTSIIEGIIGTKLDDTVNESAKICDDELKDLHESVSESSDTSVCRTSYHQLCADFVNFSLGASALLKTPEQSFLNES